MNEKGDVEGKGRDGEGKKGREMKKEKKRRRGRNEEGRKEGRERGERAFTDFLFYNLTTGYMVILLTQFLTVTRSHSRDRL